MFHHDPCSSVSIRGFLSQYLLPPCLRASVRALILLLLLNLCTLCNLWMPSAQAQELVHARIAVPSMSPEEAEDGTPDLGPGYLFWREDIGPQKLWITMGGLTGGVMLNPDDPNWATIPAEADVVLNQFALKLDDRYRWYANNTKSAWGTGSGDMITIQGGAALMRVLSLTYNAAANTITLDIDAGQAGVAPVVVYTLDLTADPQVWTEVESYTLDPALSGADGRTTATISPHVGDPLGFATFYRFTAPELPPPSINLIANTIITGDLTVSGAIPRAADIDLGVTAHTWGDHAAAGYSSVVLDGAAPATSDAPGTPGTLIQSGNFLYICIAPDTWRRTPLFDWE